jgi:hypothetical protein
MGGNNITISPEGFNISKDSNKFNAGRVKTGFNVASKNQGLPLGQDPPLSFFPILWLDASDESTIHLSDATHVEKWDDKSGNGNHLTQTNLNEQPTKGTNCIVYDGVQDELKKLMLPPKALFIIYDTYPSDGNYHRLFSINGNVDIGILQWTNNRISFSGVGGIFEDVAGGIPKVAHYRFTQDVDGNNKLIYMNYNHGFGNSSQNGTISAGLNYNSSTFRLGGHVNAAYSYGGNMREVLAFDRIITTEERDEILTYLQNKWNII